MNILPNVHIVDNYLINPTNPVTINLIGVGGTGSQLLTALARISHALLALGHPGLQLTIYDDDKVSEANIGRQLFAESEIGLMKGIALVNRINRFFGTNWKAVPKKFELENLRSFPDDGKATLFVSCVDSAKARFDISEALYQLNRGVNYGRHKPLYWMDLGNSRQTGQVIVSTIDEVKQPSSEIYQPIAKLPFVTTMFKDLLESQNEDDTPSCSLAEALTKQDLFINSTLANMGASLLWQMFREGVLFNRGFFLNLKDFRTQPLKVA